MRHRPHHEYEYATLILDFLDCGLFLAIWISLAVAIALSDADCSVPPPGSGHLQTTACKTIYAALALAVVAWISFVFSIWRDYRRLRADWADPREPKLVWAKGRETHESEAELERR